MRTLNKYNRTIRGMQIKCREIFGQELDDLDCIRLLATKEGKRFVAWLESLPPTYNATKSIKIPFA